MGNFNVTDLLLTVLIGLVGFIGKIFYDKLSQIDGDIKKTMIEEMGIKN